MSPLPLPVLDRHPTSGVERFRGSWGEHRTRHHAHPEYQLTLTEAGLGRCEYLGHRAAIPPGCLMLFHPGEPHVLATAGRGGWSLRVLHVPPRWLEDGGVPLLQPAPLPPESGVAEAFAAVWTACDRGGIEAALAVLSAVLRRRPGVDAAPRDRSALVRRCLDHLAATLDRPVPVAELARVARSTPARVRRAVAEATGLPPQAWHLQRRIAEAKHRLADGAAIVEVALHVGFADQAHFTRHFTRLVGVSPSRYAAGTRSGRL